MNRIDAKFELSCDELLRDVQPPKDAGDVNCLALVRGEEKYLFLFRSDEQSKAEAVRTIGRFAANPELSLTWLDAAALTKRIRNDDFPSWNGWKQS